MPIDGVLQPEFIEIEHGLRLRKFSEIDPRAIGWYQDPETVLLVDGVARPYDAETLERMYTILERCGELYYIEVEKDGEFLAVGDVTFWQQDMPIVIGNPELRGKGIGKKVIAALIERGRHLSYSELFVGEIYDFNTASQRCFESLGFKKNERTEKGWSYRLALKGE